MNCFAKMLVLFGAFVCLTSSAFGQTLEGVDLPDSAVIARSGGAVTTKPGEIPDIIAISNINTLTQGDIRLVTPYFEWVLQTPLSVAERNELRRRIIADWTRPDSDLPKIITSRSAWGFIKGVPSTDRTQFTDPEKSDDQRRLLNQAQILAKLRARSSDEDAQWILARYAAAHRPLTTRTPVLTQPIADMFSGATVFALNEVAGKKVASDTPAFRAALTRRLVSQWPQMTSPQRHQITDLPTRWAAFKKFYWPYASEGGREEERVIWGRQLSGSFPAIRAAAERRAKSWDAIQAKKRAAWARLSSSQQEQLISAAIAQNAAATRAVISAMSEAQMVSHATNMNIINNSRSSPGPINYYYVH